MFSIESTCSKVSKYISTELNLDKEKESVINYGIFAFVQTFLSILAVFILGIVFNLVVEAMIISFTISILRKYSGGIHSESPNKCIFIGAATSVTLAFLCKIISNNIGLVILLECISFILSYRVVYRLAPVDSDSKPIKREEKRTKLKKKSLKVVSIYLVLVIINIACYFRFDSSKFLVYSQCINWGLLWQVFSLTKGGHVLLGRLDKMI